MRRRTWSALGAFVVAAAAASGLAARADDGGTTFEVHARISGAMGSLPCAIDIARDGRTAVTFEERSDAPAFTYAIALTDAERTALRGAIATSGFFDESWGPDRMESHTATWDVTLVVGDRTRSRTVRGQPEFAAVAACLWRAMNQALVARSLSEGKWQDVEAASSRMLRPAALVPEISECVVRAGSDWSAGEAAAALVVFVPPGEWAERTVPLLARLSGTRRDVVLASWAHATSAPGREAVRAALAPAALAEVDAGRSGWADAGRQRRETLRTLLATALAAHAPGALDLAGEMVRTLSRPGDVFVPRGLAEAGRDGVALVVALLMDANPDAREAAVRAAHGLIGAVRKPSRSDARLTDDARTALEADVAEFLVPALTSRSRADDEALETRHLCFSAIAVWDGRDLAAERRAERERQVRERDEAGRRRAAEDEARRAASQQPPTPSGEFSISGSVAGQDGVALVDFAVLAMRDDGPPDARWRTHGGARTDAVGAFEIGGLVAGTFRLVALAGTNWGPRDFANNRSAREGVAVGSTGVALRFPGAMLRGRLLDEDGRPVARRSVAARMRDAPTVLTEPGLDVSGWCRTDSEGHFAMLQLLPGTYDVEVPGVPLLRGARGLVARPDEVVVTVLAGGSITGRVIDERDEPLPGAWVVAVAADTPGEQPRTTSGADGTFLLSGLDPELTYAVAASFSVRPEGATRHQAAGGVRTGTTDLALRVDTGPRVEFTVEFGSRRAPGRGDSVRLVRLGDGEPRERRFPTGRVLWRMAPAGTWSVAARVRDIDDEARPVEAWVDLGTVRTGDPPQTLTVPR